MKRFVFGLTMGWLVFSCEGVAQEKRENPRPVERPSRTVEELLRRQKAAKEEEERRAAEAKETAEPAESSGAKKGEKSTPSVFRVGGAEVYEVARQAGWKFFPKGARGALDGQNTVVEVQPGVVYSVVQGPVMTQRRTVAGWGAISQNAFYLFTDARGGAKSLAPGWTVRDLQLSGDPFQWINRPKAGSASPSLAIQIAGGRSVRNSVVRLDGLVLQGPPEAKDWRAAFAVRKP